MTDKMFPFFKMDIYEKDTILTTVVVNSVDFSTFSVLSYDLTNIMQPFHTGITELKQVQDFLQDRTFDKARPDKNKLLGMLGLKTYDVFQVALKTHGILLNDYLWLRFDDEPFTWEDAYAILHND